MAGERPDVDSIKAKHRATYKRTADLQKRKAHQQITISHAPALIALVADCHIGNPGTNIDRIYEEQALINNTPGAYTFLLGDIADSFLVGRLRDINMVHDVTIPEEWALVEDYVNGWNNLLGFVGGNHDAWSRTLVGMDLHRKIIADGAVLYDTDDMRVTINVGPFPIRFRMRHQFLGRSQYNVTHAQEKSIKFDDPWPDILVSGHTHTGALARELSHAGVRKIAIQLGSYKATDDFAIQLGLPQTDNSTAAAVIVMPDGSYFATGSLRAACQFMRSVYR
jgi:predicted phosphodiesterase